MSSTIDPAFLDLPLQRLADAALTRARELGAEHAELRCDQTRQAEWRLRDGALLRSRDCSDRGLGVRVLVGGAWGFAGSKDVDPTSAARVASLAVDVARACRPLDGERVELVDEPVYPDARWTSSYECNPFDVPETEIVGQLAAWSERLLAHRAVDHVDAKLRTTQETKFYADLAGTNTLQQRVRIYPQITSVATGGGAFETMRTLAPPVGRGWEYVHGAGWDWEDELTQLPDLLAEKLRAPSVEAGTYDLVIDPSNLWLTIHETVGHATELDRMLGYEAAYAGTSFARFEDVHRLRYGSPAMHVTGDRTVTHGLATVGFDDEGVRATTWDIVRDGMLTGYQLDRQLARRARLDRSNGCAFAESARHPALQRMPNVSLQPAADGPSTADLIAGVERGLYVVGDKSWSIDAQRRNFQFTGQRFYKIEHGRLAGQVRDAAYQGLTSDLWASLEAVGGPATFALYGADLCGKGQPIQISAASHGAPSTLFRRVRVVNARREGVH